MGIDDLIEWKVGESADYDLEFLFPGTSHKEVASEVKGAIWLHQTMTMGFLGEVKTRAKISRKTAEILELWVNDEKQDVPEQNIEIIKQEEDRITVPAGRFDTIKVTIKDLDSDSTSIVWMNPIATPMEGTVQMEAETQMGPMVMKLTAFDFAN